MPYVSKGLHSDRIPGTERHLISLQFTDSDFQGQELVGQVYYRDESLRFYPFPTVNANKQVTAFSSSQQDTDQYGMKLTLNSELMDGWQITWGWMLIMSALPLTRCSSIWFRRALPEG